MVNNGTLHYDHDRDGTHTQVAGCSAKFRGREHDTFVKIKYADDTVTGEQAEGEGWREGWRGGRWMGNSGVW